MPDREKVIKGLECCLERAKLSYPYEYKPYIMESSCEHSKCPYLGCCEDMLFDIYNLLKKQEAVKFELEECPYCHKVFQKMDIGNHDPQKIAEGIAKTIEAINNGGLFADMPTMQSAT